MPPCTFDWRPPALDFLKSVCSTIILSLFSHMGLIYSRAMAIDFINQPNYYTETLTHSSLLAFGAVKTIASSLRNRVDAVRSIRRGLAVLLAVVMLGRSFLRARWSAFSNEDVVTGEIVAPVTRSRLVRYVKTFSEHRYGRWVLAAIAFADSSFLPIPPDLLLVPMALVRPKQIWALSLICTVASSLGALVGYLIGYGLWSLVGVPLVELYGYGNGFTARQPT